MEAASFTAWQILASKGYKKGWSAYRKGMGLDTKQENKISKEQKGQAIGLALEIDRKYGSGAPHART